MATTNCKYTWTFHFCQVYYDFSFFLSIAGMKTATRLKRRVPYMMSNLVNKFNGK